ncbi:hypothetical protein Tsubulata_032480 [Turnera subulata]|uniref:DUF4283 domain-containing protein n=1 Tax=Turnera subulata TaxID=218843 RepID=A0A9Q0F9Y0_9ROSI|nr:hypothetical protein Tsubulata_032480 [Turnera subulata]
MSSLVRDSEGLGAATAPPETVQERGGTTDGIVVIDHLPEEPHLVFSKCLVGKLWTVKNFNANALLRTVTSIWNPRKGVEASEIGSNLFLFQFNDNKDIERVLEGEPWHFDRHILVLQKISGDEQPSTIAPSKTPIWAHLYDVPLRLRSEGLTPMVVRQLGKYLGIDKSLLPAKSKVIKVRVRLDLTQTLRTQTMKDFDDALELEEEGDVVVSGDFLRASPIRRTAALTVEPRRNPNAAVRKPLFDTRSDSGTSSSEGEAASLEGQFKSKAVTRERGSILGLEWGPTGFACERHDGDI